MLPSSGVVELAVSQLCLLWSWRPKLHLVPVGAFLRALWRAVQHREQQSPVGVVRVRPSVLMRAERSRLHLPGYLRGDKCSPCCGQANGKKWAQWVSGDEMLALHWNLWSKTRRSESTLAQSLWPSDSGLVNALKWQGQEPLLSTASGNATAQNLSTVRPVLGCLLCWSLGESPDLLFSGPAEAEPCLDLHADHSQHLLFLLVQPPRRVVMQSVGGKRQRMSLNNCRLARALYSSSFLYMPYLLVLFPCGQGQGYSCSVALALRKRRSHKNWSLIGRKCRATWSLQHFGVPSMG